MISSIVICHIFTGLSIFCTVGPRPLAEVTKQELHKRGLEETFENVCFLADEAFAKEDEALFMLLFKNMLGGWEEDKFGDKILALYRIHPDTEFKKKIALFVACGLSDIPRIAQSKYGCEFYSLAVDIMLDPNPQPKRMYALMCIDHLFHRVGFSLIPYFVKMLLVMPSSDMIVISTSFDTLNSRFSTVTPEMAYHIYRTYQKEFSFQKYKRMYEEKAKPLLDAPSLPESASHATVLKQLDELITEEGHKYLKTYKDVEPKPYTPPTPPSIPPGYIEITDGYIKCWVKQGE